MFDWLKKIQESAANAAEMMDLFEQMLDDGRHVFDAAANALVGGTDPKVVKEDIWETDKRINHNERKIRRRLLTHGAINGRSSLPGDLVLMSLIKDAERIGDYSKNVYDLAFLGPELPALAKRELIEMKDSASRMLVRCKNIYRSEDEDAAHGFIVEANVFVKHCDVRTNEMVMRLEGDGNSAAAALAYRYFKRVVSHAMNIITSVVVPLDRLDYYDEKN
jgi:phosphate transport system protein